MIRILIGHVLDRLAELPDESVHCVVTSPPYYGLRDYGIEPQVWGGDPGCDHSWEAHERGLNNRHAVALARGDEGTEMGGTTNHRDFRLKTDFCRHCNAWRGSLGLEPTLELYLEHMVEVFREVRRVMRKDATCWLNIGDSYATNRNDHVNGGWGDPSVRDHSTIAKRGRFCPAGLKMKDLMLIPSRLAIRLQEDGWWVRSDIAWCKRAPMPESCADRPTTAWEHVFLLTKSAKYFYDQEAVKEEAEGDDGTRHHLSLPGTKDYHDGRTSRYQGYKPPKRNMRNFWLLGPEPFPEAHFATFPTEIPRRAILAGTSERGVCPKCGAPWARVVEKNAAGRRLERDGINRGTDDRGLHMRVGESETETIGWRQTCSCDARGHDGFCVPCQTWHTALNPCVNIPSPIAATVLDPFLGAGTTALVADQLQRDCIGIELNPKYAEMAESRLREDNSLFAEVAAE